MRTSLLVSAALLVAACGPSRGASDTSTVPAETSTSIPVTTIAAAPACASGEDFTDHDRVARIDQPASDTTSLGLITWQQQGDGCERFGIEFDTAEGAPATTPPSITVDFLETRQILRIWADVDTTVVTDQLVETGLVDRLYVVRALNGGLFVDLHLAHPAQVRAQVSNSPARLAVEMEAGTEPFEGSAAISDHTVLTAPTDGSQQDGSVAVEGYARTFEANVTVIATVGDQIVADMTATAADWSATWGEFMTRVELPPGTVDLFVGERNPRDERLDGVTLSLVVR
ncbi:MAG: Gmad2 immunoglobulin-like domain-containing protein [Acidimicrobiia bacterium]